MPRQRRQLRPQSVFDEPALRAWLSAKDAKYEQHVRLIWQQAESIFPSPPPPKKKEEEEDKTVSVRRRRRIVALPICPKSCKSHCPVRLCIVHLVLWINNGVIMVVNWSLSYNNNHQPIMLMAAANHYHTGSKRSLFTILPRIVVKIGYARQFVYHPKWDVG
jgi:hypothetical protein